MAVLYLCGMQLIGEVIKGNNPAGHAISARNGRQM
jgi:hypothetical protein